MVAKAAYSLPAGDVERAGEPMELVPLQGIVETSVLVCAPRLLTGILHNKHHATVFYCVAGC
jgi:hypothetical protein